MARRALAAVALALVLLALNPAGAAGVKSLATVQGAQLWFAEDHALPMIALVASFPAGSAYDPSAKSGTAAFAAALMDEGAGNLDGDAFHAALDDRGIQFAVEPGRDSTTVTMTMLSSDAKVAFHLFAMALAHPRFDAEAVSRVRTQMLQDLEAEQEDPASVAENGFYSFYFGAHAYGHPIEGDARGLKAITASDLRAFALTHWVRAGLQITIAGDVDAKTAAALVRSTFGPLGASAPPPPQAPSRVGAPGLHILPMDVPQPAAVFALPSLTRGDPDYLTAYVADTILGGSGFSSRLTDEVREKRGLTYDVSTDLATYKTAGIMLGEVASKAGSMRQSLGVVRDTMAKFSDRGPTEQELDDAKTYLEGAWPLAFASNAGMAAQLNDFQQMGLPIDYLDRRNDLIEAISIADVRRVAGRLFDPAKMTIVVAGSLPAATDDSAP